MVQIKKFWTAQKIENNLGFALGYKIAPPPLPPSVKFSKNLLIKMQKMQQNPKQGNPWIFERAHLWVGESMGYIYPLKFPGGNTIYWGGNNNAENKINNVKVEVMWSFLKHLKYCFS